MPDTIRIPARVSGRRVAELSAELARDGARRLFIPVSISFQDAMSVASLVQSVITWGVHPADNTLVCDVDTASVSGARLLARNAALLVAIELASRIEAPNGRDITVSCKALASRTLHESSNDVPQLATGVTVGTDRTMMAVDHDPALRFPRGIYPRGPLDEQARPFFTGRLRTDVSQLRGRHPLGHRVLGVSGQRPEGWADRYSATGSALGMVLFELLQNTDIHARTNIQGKPLARSVRLMHVRGYAQSVDVLTRSDPDNRPLMEFYARTRSANQPSGVMRFLAVSILDSGPGLARTLMRRENILSPESPAHELTYFLRALRMTSSGSTREPLRGLGLRRVQALLSELGGFARIRSGRFNIQRDFLQHPFGGADERESMWWGGVAAPTPREKTAGTALTLLLPIPPRAEAERLWRAAEDVG